GYWKPRLFVPVRVLTQACLLAFVPDVGCELPLTADLFPYHYIFPGNFLLACILRFEAEGSDLARRRCPKWFHVKGDDFGIANLFRDAFPHCLDRGSALHHGRSRR